MHDFVTILDDMKNIGHHNFSYEFSVVPEEHSIVLTKSSQNPKTNRKYMMQFMFDTFNVPATYVAIQAGSSP